MGVIRTFIALSIAERIRNNASNLIARLSDSGVAYNWMEDSNLHITLNFVGDLPELEVPEFCKDVRAVVGQHKKFGVMVTGLSAFPIPQEPRVIWLGITEGTDELKQLNRQLADLLARWGVPKERHDYHPHLTLGRVQRSGRWNQDLLERLERHRNHDGGWFQANEVIVYSSFLDRGGPTYTPMSRVKLGQDS